jgi:uncharacterized damage-inducible protein DinB
MSVESLFLEFSAGKLIEFMSRIETCTGKLTEDQIWARGHANENAIGNLIVHLNGNVRQWILAALAGDQDHRDRDAEFAALSGPPVSQLLANLRETIQRAGDVIRALKTAQLTRIYEIQNYEVSGVDVVFHVVEHFAQHTGQIVFATKMLTAEDMGFYRHLSGATHPAPGPKTSGGKP